jgi:hypothetical protein
MRLYGDYLTANFASIGDTVCWLLLARTGPAVSEVPGAP